MLPVPGKEPILLYAVLSYGAVGLLMLFSIWLIGRDLTAIIGVIIVGGIFIYRRIKLGYWD